MALLRKKAAMPKVEEALPGRSTPLRVPEKHFVNGHRIVSPFPVGLNEAVFGMGCFWGAERLFWELPGVYSTAVGYAGGFTPNPTYEEVCSGETGHAEVVRVIYDPQKIRYEELLKAFWESHDPTQGMRQGNDLGTQYRSAIYTLDPQQRQAAEASRRAYQARLTAAGRGAWAAHMGRGMRCKYRGFLSGAGEACQIELIGDSQTAIPRSTALSPPVLPISCWYPFLVVVNGVVPTYNSMLSCRPPVNFQRNLGQLGRC
ncbi:MAG: peptide-methionine (S)-S-oxide reductase MsrA [Gammaproteobacteria bacterium]|nr:MAG: peptide-methionine (S)-S-oxide reductase MsrA [Gammaproteobacteria bacterium]